MKKRDYRGNKNPNYKGKIQKSCAICGQCFEIIPYLKDKIFTCSKKCSGKFRVRRKITKKCICCGHDFEIPACYKSRKKYCNKKCYLFHINSQIEKRCIICNSVFKVPRHRDKKTCSGICAKKYNASRVAETNKSEIKRQQVSKARKGKKGHPISVEHKLKLKKILTGRIVSKETREKLSKTRKRLGLVGAKSSNWHGGKSFEPYGMAFDKKLKNSIRRRDHHSCIECGYTQERLGYKLHVHHMDYNKNNNNPDNLISLCRSCHAQTNFKREDWEIYFKNKLRKAFVA